MSQKQEGSRSRADYFLHLALALLRWKLAGPVAFTSLVRCVGASSVAFWQSGRVSTCQPTERQAKPPFDSVGKEADEGGRGGGNKKPLQALGPETKHLRKGCPPRPLLLVATCPTRPKLGSCKATRHTTNKPSNYASACSNTVISCSLGV